MTTRSTTADARPRVLACDCGEDIVAVLSLTPEVASHILDRRDALLAAKKTTPDLAWILCDNVAACRFFGESGEGVAALLDAFEAAIDAAEEGDSAWVEIDRAVVPAGGDYRTAFEHIKISEHYICFEGQGQHAGDSFETADLPLVLLVAVAAGRPPGAAGVEGTMPEDREAALTAEVRSALTLCERGNTLLLGPDGDDLLFIATVEGDVRFFVEYRESNYPAFNTWFAEYSPEALITLIAGRYDGWVCRKNNHGLVVDANGFVVGLPVDEGPDEEEEPDEDEPGEA